MGCKPWQKMGAVFLGSMLLYGCQDTPRRDNGLSKVPPPQFPATTTPGAPGSAATGAWSSPNNGFRTGTPASTGLSPAGAPSNLSVPASPSAGFSSGSYNTAPPAAPGSTGQAIQIQPPTNPTSFASPSAPLTVPPSSFGTGLTPSFPPVSGPTAPGLPSTPAPLPPGQG